MMRRVKVPAVAASTRARSFWSVCASFWPSSVATAFSVEIKVSLVEQPALAVLHEGLARDGDDAAIGLGEKIALVAGLRGEGLFGERTLDTVPKLVDPFAVPRRDRDHVAAEVLSQALRVDDDAAMSGDVHHVERDDHGQLELQRLQHEVQAALEARGVDDAHHEIWRGLVA